MIVFVTNCYPQSTNYYAKGKDDFLTGNYGLCVKNLLKSKSNTSEKDVDYFIAMSYFNLKKFDSAILYFDKDLKINKNNFNSYIKKAESEKNLHQYKAAVKDLDQLLKLNTNYFLAYYEKGEINFEQKYYTLAMDFYNKALIIKPHLENAFYKLGFCYLYLKDTVNACENWKKIEDLDDFEQYQKIEIICNKFNKTK